MIPYYYILSMYSMFIYTPYIQAMSSDVLSMFRLMAYLYDIVLLWVQGVNLPYVK